MSKNVAKCVEVIKKRAPGFTPKIGMILGSGLGAVSAQIQNPISIPYSELPKFSITNVAGHGKKLHLGMLRGTPVACLEGRTHFYEGDDAVHSLKTMIRTLKTIGCNVLLTTNAVGSLRLDQGPGSLMLIEDHINFMSKNPLTGPNDDDFGDRFVSMDNAYDQDLREKMQATAKKLDIPLSSGVYLATSGPTFESHAEIRMFQMLGAHAVGMSTVPETKIARHCGMKVVSVSTITNFGAGMSSEVLSHEGTLKGAAMGVDRLAKLFLGFIEDHGQQL